MTDLLPILWAKTNPAGQVHPLLFHLIDAGQVALALWRLGLPDSSRAQLAQGVGLNIEQAGRLFATWTALHDIGKASPAFQAKFPPIRDILRQNGLGFPEKTAFCPQPHGMVSAWVLQTRLGTFGLDYGRASLLARVLGGHHGLFPTDLQMDSVHQCANLGGPQWEELRGRMLQMLRDIFQPAQVAGPPAAVASWNAMLCLFAGLTSVSDWVSSMENSFPFADPDMPVEAYMSLSAQRAEETVRRLGWCSWNPPRQAMHFEPVFGFAPNAIQRQVMQTAQGLQAPALVILEAPTGTGKTEAAFALADAWLLRSQGRGCYVAMPTTATSNQMFERTTRFLQTRYPHELVNLQLLHGQAILDDRFEDTVLHQIGEETELRVGAMEWFLPRKRALLAPFGVGTVDQSFLGVLQTRHFFVRLFGLQNKVVIFDEVHAYDVYMSQLFWRLLEWLKAIGASVIVLSATLTRSTRRAMAGAFCGHELAQLADAGYPQLTVATEDSAQCYALPNVARRTVHLERVARDPDAIALFLQRRLDGGGCAAVICNTVKRAQQVYRAVCTRKVAPQEDCILFHARFPAAWRKGIEERVLDRFGKNGVRPQCGVVVATQVIEQSLDLDFDLMVSDLCPADLLIQRAGRLHRHPRNNRPGGVQGPVLAIAEPDQNADRRPSLGPDAYVYEPYYLLRTLVCLEGKTQLLLPDETTGLIEAAYEENTAQLLGSPLWPHIQQARSKMERERQKSVHNALQRLIRAPQDDEMLTCSNLDLEEDAPEVHEALRALTREGKPGVTLVCLHQMPDGQLAFDPQDSLRQLELVRAPDRDTTRRLMGCSIHVQDGRVVAHFCGQGAPAAWSKSAILRHCHPVVFQNGLCRLDDSVTLCLNREMGLQVLQREEVQ